MLFKSMGPKVLNIFPAEVRTSSSIAVLKSTLKHNCVYHLHIYYQYISHPSGFKYSTSLKVIFILMYSAFVMLACS